MNPINLQSSLTGHKQTETPAVGEVTHNICMISDDFMPAVTGVGIHIQSVAEGLVENGHNVTIITTRRPGQPKFEIWKNVKVYRVFSIKAFGFYQALATQKTIKRILNENKITIVHHHYLSFLMIQANICARKLNLLQVYTYHMTADHLTQPKPMRVFRSILEKQIVKLSNKMNLVISPSKKLATKISLGGIKTPTVHITNPVVFKDVSPSVALIKKDEFNILFAGRLCLEKNIPLLLRAMKKLIIEKPNSVLWLAGTGDQKDNLMNMCRDLGISSSVRFLGFLNHTELAHYYSRCNVFVLPSFVETQGMVAMEAMRFSRPIIVSKDIVSAEELVESSVNGFIVDSINENELVEKLLLLSNNPELQKNMGAAGYNHSLSYNPKLVISQLEQSYNSILQQRL